MAATQPPIAAKLTKFIDEASAGFFPLHCADWCAHKHSWFQSKLQLSGCNNFETNWGKNQLKDISFGRATYKPYQIKWNMCLKYIFCRFYQCHVNAVQEESSIRLSYCNIDMLAATQFDDSIATYLRMPNQCWRLIENVLLCFSGSLCLHNVFLIVK